MELSVCISSVCLCVSHAMLKVEIVEICLHDYGFLKYFRSSFIKNLKMEVPEKNYDRTILSFGNAYVRRVMYVM
jgi:hypothetical protein